MIDIKIKGLGKLNRKLDNIAKGLPKALQSGISEAIKNTYEAVYRVCPVDTGETRDSIKYEVSDIKSGMVSGRVWSDSEIAVYLNFGTGIYAEGEGGSRAEKIPWFVHVSMADLSKYGYKIYTAPDGEQYYIVYGMHATHFFDNTAFQRRDLNIEDVTKAISEYLWGFKM